nr:hypothetical protein [Tanacetum cinerariifolium]
KKNSHETLLMMKVLMIKKRLVMMMKEMRVMLVKKDKRMRMMKTKMMMKEMMMIKRGIQATLDVEDSHVTLTPIHPDGQQESSSISSHFVTSMLNPPSDAVAADLSEMVLKKILIEKMEGNKSIQRSDEQRNLYKALVDAYEADKTILDSYGETVILKRRHDDDDDQENGPSVGSDQGSKRRREGKKPKSA